MLRLFKKNKITCKISSVELGNSEELILSNNQLDIFKKGFFEVNMEMLRFPEKIFKGKIHEVQTYKRVMRDCWNCRFYIAIDEHNNWFMELFSSNDDCSWHYLINHEGEKVKLENYKGEFGRPIYSDSQKTKLENEKIDRHNYDLNNELIAKGLEEGNSEFESRNVIKFHY